MLYIYLPVLYYHGNIYVTEEAYAGRRGFPLSQRSFLFFKLVLVLSSQYFIDLFFHSVAHGDLRLHSPPGTHLHTHVGGKGGESNPKHINPSRLSASHRSAKKRLNGCQKQSGVWSCTLETFLTWCLVTPTSSAPFLRLPHSACHGIRVTPSADQLTKD